MNVWQNVCYCMAKGSTCYVTLIAIKSELIRMDIAQSCHPSSTKKGWYNSFGGNTFLFVLFNLWQIEKLIRCLLSVFFL